MPATTAMRQLANCAEGLGEIIGRSPQMQAVYRMIETVAANASTVLITGESGTGKELVACAIHQLSARRGRLFVTINCGACAETLLEPDLFGYVKGAFTGAVANHKGLFEAADGGTIFLDEIGEMSLTMQIPGSEDTAGEFSQGTESVPRAVASVAPGLA